MHFLGRAETCVDDRRGKRRVDHRDVRTDPPDRFARGSSRNVEHRTMAGEGDELTYQRFDGGISCDYED
jgi:hypothetical protein